jgi:uncharacterized protein
LIEIKFSMPILDSTYKPPSLLWNGHLQTIVPSVFRKVQGINYQRERITTPDGDFLDLDWSEEQSDNLVVVSHGLEGNSTRHYVQGIIKAFNDIGWSAMGWNFRGCSGEINNKKTFYHSGATYDLDHVVSHVIKNKKYKKVALVGFSLGGNLTLKYLGEKGDSLPDEIIGATTFSVPLNLQSCAAEIDKRSNFIYNKRFLINLVKKIKDKSLLMPDELDASYCSNIKSLKEFDDLYTAPIHGFKDAEEYYQINSSMQFLKDITRPTLIINALNDPFLAPDCYPRELLENHLMVYLETPAEGGHCGFPLKNKNNLYYTDKRAVEFLVGQLKILKIPNQD